MRDYSHIEQYLNKLSEQIYKQPADDGHTEWARDAIKNLTPLDVRGKRVLDVGCGSGFCGKIFKNWYGIECVGQDYNIDGSDFSFLSFIEDGSFDMVFARHVLEHSPMPLLTLMEWERISKQYLMVILPAPEYWQAFGKNHYYVLPKEQWWNLFDVAGWKIINEQDFTTSDELFMRFFLPEAEPHERVWQGPPKIVEFRYLLEKK